MDTTELNKPEVIFELRLRGQNAVTAQTADELRTQLDNLLALPDCPLPATTSPNDFATDMTEITKCLKILESCLNTFQFVGTRSQLTFPISIIE